VSFDCTLQKNLTRSLASTTSLPGGVISALVIPTKAYPDFLLRDASNHHVCGSAQREPYAAHRSAVESLRSRLPTARTFSLAADAPLSTDASLGWVQLGSLCLGVIRQTLPGWHQGSRNSESMHVQATDSKQEGDLDGSAVAQNVFGPANATVPA
jgi:hypothetical protein